MASKGLCFNKMAIFNNSSLFSDARLGLHAALASLLTAHTQTCATWGGTSVAPFFKVYHRRDGENGVQPYLCKGH